MLRTRLTRFTVLAAALATLATVGTAAAASQAGEQITLGPSGPIAVDKNYRYFIDLTCPASPEATPCEGILSIWTAYAIKPYRTIAKKKWVVGAFEYKAQAGQTVKVPARILGGGAAQLALTGTVKIRADIVDDGAKVGSQILTLTKKRR